MAEKVEIEIVISEDGQVHMKVRGMKGHGCEDEIKPFEDDLGIVRVKKNTSEAYEQPTVQTEVGVGKRRGARPPGLTRLAVTPPGKEKMVRELKKQPGVDNPWAIAWAQHNREKGEKKAAVEADLYGRALSIVQRLEGTLPDYLEAPVYRLATKTASTAVLLDDLRSGLDRYLRQNEMPETGESWACLAELADCRKP